MDSHNPISLSFDNPATYRIVVQGRVNQNFSDRLEGMTIYHAIKKGVLDTTTLEGELSDQATLAGILNFLYEQHLTVISVERLEE